MKKTEPDLNQVQSQEMPAVLAEATVHLHNHSQFSILQSTISIKKLVNATAKRE